MQQAAVRPGHFSGNAALALGLQKLLALTSGSDNLQLLF
jgi:hypothetical protein